VGGWRPAAGPLGTGVITDLVVDRRHPSTLFAASVDGAVFKSEDGGRNWQPLDLAAGITRVDSLAMSPADPGTLYAGTGDGVFKTVDGGASWRASNIGLRFTDPAEHRDLEGYIYDLQIHPDQPDTVYGTTGCCPGIAWLSTSAGAIWTPLTTPFRRAWALRLTLDPSNPGTLYGLAYLRSGIWLLRSSNRGVSWHPLAYPLRWGRAATITVDPIDPQILYLGACRTSGASQVGGLLKSTDGGTNWRLVHRGCGEHLVFDPDRPGTMYRNAWPHLYVSTDGAVSWRKLDPGAEPRLLAANAGTLYADTAAGVVRSRNAGRSWHALPAQPVTAPVTSLAVDPQRPGTAYAGVDGSGFSKGGVFKRVDGVWRPVNTGLTSKGIHAVAVNPASPNHVYVAADRGLFLSTDGAGSWHKVLGSAAAIALDPQQPGTVYAIATRDDLGDRADPPRNLFKSTDAGTHWQQLRTPVTASDDNAAILIDPRHNRVYASAGTGLVRTDDGGKMWDFAGLTERVVQAMILDRRARTLYAGTDAGLFTSRDGAQTWHRARGALQSADVQSLAVVPNADRTVYAGTDRAVFRSADGGRTWHRLGHGLPLRTYDALAIDRAAGLLYAGAYGAGIYEYTLAARHQLAGLE
jgi:photosystem II stability/assembly factor-like uncharacterized protein